MGRRAQRRRRDAARHRESIFNLFLYFENNVCRSVGYVEHQHPGTDTAAEQLLLGQVEADLAVAQRLPLSSPFSAQDWSYACRSNGADRLLGPVLARITDIPTPLTVKTCVEEGQVRVDFTRRSGEAGDEPGSTPDWMVRYSQHGHLDVGQLVNDDYFVAIRLLMNSGLYVSGMKLLLSAIDSIAYLEYGDRGSPFVPWLETYADLTPVQVTAEELWELRNGLLHMSSYNSRKVTKGAVRKISYGTGIKPGYHEEAEVFLFDFMDLVHAFAAALQRWIPTVQADPDKLRAFVDRYDQVLSDTRIARRPAPDSP